ncbi:MAG: hypothetical protein ACTSRG_07490 [Candidatus Helarchaeota archaeon]
MIKGIFVMSQTGICLYNKFISTSSPNDQLFGGFISALDRFCKTSIGECISYLSTASLKLHFFHINELIFVFISDKNDLTKKLLPCFQNLIEEFCAEFAEQQVRFENQGLLPDLKKFDHCFSNVCV